jgi:hypothetical protein
MWNLCLPMHLSTCFSSATVERIFMEFVIGTHTLEFTEPAVCLFISIIYDRINDFETIIHMKFKSNCVDFPRSSSLHNCDVL